MDNDLNKYFVTVNVYQGEQQVHSVIAPRSLIHDMFQQWKYPGSPFDVRIIDHTGNYRINSAILNQ